MRTFLCLIGAVICCACGQLICPEHENKAPPKSGFLKVLETIKVGDGFVEISKKVANYNVLGNPSYPLIICRDAEGKQYFFFFIFPDPDTSELGAIVQFPPGRAEDDKGIYILPKNRKGQKFSSKEWLFKSSK